MLDLLRSTMAPGEELVYDVEVVVLIEGDHLSFSEVSLLLDPDDPTTKIPIRVEEMMGLAGMDAIRLATRHLARATGAQPEEVRRALEQYRFGRRERLHGLLDRHHLGYLKNTDAINYLARIRLTVRLWEG